jgi:formate-nitrite transporter family protein
MPDKHAPGEGAWESDLPRSIKVEAERRVDPSAAVLHETIEIQGEEELARPFTSVAWSGLAAGLTMGLSMVGEGMLRAKLPDASWSDLVSSLGYTAGFVFVTLGKQQLYTESTLTATLPVLNAWRRLHIVLRFWAIVFATNIIGTLLFAWAATIPGVFEEAQGVAFRELGVRALEGGFGTVLLQGIVAGWVIALMVWILPAAGSATVLVIVGATYLIAAAHLAHVVAGSVEVGYAAMVGAIGWGEYAFGFIVPALIGNSIGGIVFVALLNHAQVEKEDEVPEHIREIAPPHAQRPLDEQEPRPDGQASR